MTVVASLNGSLSGCDSNTAITSYDEALCLWNSTPYYFIFRYISNYDTEQSGDLSSYELNNLAIAGWSVGLVQHALAGGSTLTSALGTTIGNRAVNNAKSITAPTGAYLWLDIENYGSGSDPIGFCQAWSNAVKADGTFKPALYYGAPGLSISQVQSLLNNGYFMAAWAGCGQYTGIGESIDQGPCLTTMTGTCNGYTWNVPIDKDTLLSGKTVGGFVVRG